MHADQRWGAETAAVRGDISGRDQVRDAVGRAHESFGGLDITPQVQLDRAALPEEAANMVAFLASEAADYICEQTIDVVSGQWTG